MNTAQQSRLSIPRLRRDISGAVVGPGDPGYDASRRVFLPAIDRHPAVIVRPVDAGEVAHVASLARQTGLELAIRGGGHSYAGHSTSEGGIVLGDNAFAFGELHVPGGDEGREALRKFNRDLAQSGRFRSTMIPTAEGLAMGVKVR